MHLPDCEYNNPEAFKLTKTWYVFTHFVYKIHNIELCYWVLLTETYCQVSTISRTLVGKEIVDHSDVVGVSPASAAPTTSSSSST